MPSGHSVNYTPKGNPMAIIVNTTEARPLIIDCIKAGLVPYLKGSPGIGKSALMHSIADEFELKQIDMRVSQNDPTDFNGFPQINKENGKATYAPFDTFPLEADEIPAGYDGWFLFMDEINGGERATQKACYKVTLDKMAGQKKLHSKVAMAAAGNLDTDGALTEELSSALQSRLQHFTLVSDYKAWLENFAFKNDIHPVITSFIQYKPEAINTFDPNTLGIEDTFACERTWHNLDKLVKVCGIESDRVLALANSAVGEGIAREFYGFSQIYKGLITVPQIIDNPMKIEVPTDPSTLYALSGSISSHADENNLSKLQPFIKRMPKTFQLLMLQEIARRTKTLHEHPVMQEWIQTEKAEIF